MRTKLVEMTDGTVWGKFLVGRFDLLEWVHGCQIDPRGGSLLSRCGWGPEHLWVLDLETGEGACFKPGGSAAADLEKHPIHVCFLYPVFLEWLYARPELWVNWDAIVAIPDTIEVDRETVLRAPPRPDVRAARP